MSVPLARERCEACSGRTPPIGADERSALLAELAPGWTVAGAHLGRSVATRAFADAFALATRIALVAEAAGHHPTLTVGWGRLEIDCTTHAIGALSRNDFRLAARIDRAAGWAARGPA